MDARLHAKRPLLRRETRVGIPAGETQVPWMHLSVSESRDKHHPAHCRALGESLLPLRDRIEGEPLAH